MYVHKYVMYNLLKMFLVTGGWDESDDRLDSTEIFDPDLESWRAGPALPSAMSNPRATNIDKRILIFGINNLEHT